MSLPDEASGNSCRLAAAYEQLRSTVLGGAGTGSHCGLVILLREGVCAWMAHAAARSVDSTPAIGEPGPRVAPVVTDDVNAALITVLTNMLMATAEERCA